MTDLPEFSPEQLAIMFSSFPVMAVVVVALVKAIRKAAPQIDGPVLVPAFAAGVGALLGAAGQLLGLLTASGWADMASPLGGMLYGSLAALSGTLGLNLGELFGQLFFKARNEAAAAPVAFLAEGSDTAAAFILQLVKDLVPRTRVTKAIEIVAPLLRQYAGAVLTDEMRAELQRQVHSALKKAGLLPESGRA